MGVFAEIAKPMIEIATVLKDILSVQRQRLEVEHHVRLIMLQKIGAEIRSSHALVCIAKSLNLLTPPRVRRGLLFVLLEGDGSMPKFSFRMEPALPEDEVIKSKLIVYTVSDEGELTERESFDLEPNATESPIFTAPHGTRIHAVLVDTDEAGLTSPPAECDGLVIDVKAPSMRQGFRFVGEEAA